MHPKYKMAYFHIENWEATWIETARQMLRDEWEKHYKPLIDPSFLEEAMATPSKNSVSFLFFMR